jgi:ABC-type lipoprotein release transport system permease subunit
MWLYIKLAWRNIFRSKRRTIIAGIAIGIGLASMIFTDALVIGMQRNMINSATESFLGEGQIHGEKFRETLEIENTINNLDKTIASLKTDSLVKDFTVRTMSLGMISSPADVSAISLIGIEPSTEKNISQIDDVIVKGEYFADHNQRDIVIGAELAELLEVELGDRMVVTVAEAHTGDLSQEMFRISGIYYFNVEEMDKGMAFVHIDKAREMLGLENQAHEIAIHFYDRNLGRNINHPFWKKYSQSDNEAVGWAVLVPQLEAVFEFSQFSTYLVGLILFSVVALGIINTLFMSLHERMFEFGVMRAVGTRPLAVGRLIIFEAGSLAVISIILGSALGLISTAITAHYGINYAGIEFAGVTFRKLLYPELKVKHFILFPVLVFMLTLAVGLYPAFFAARMKPAKALRRSF